ncbi:LysR substrate-binding domain-containing protein [Spiribacter halobius]|uniref:DNA-binding transcriptional regulator OxyR n=1 Tax=Sediminicurvatus halobius TaxID=2182432 RepID=A0A2U2N9K5_9GAMM|nr:LysR substrate-binding domain-containing protein [Spiribacter halobius]PWG65886.1 DNA-binding transcriptional regulator OxyR [Spiribacter halobius]UEX77807.1 LysR family transcriptional regulator [Spiribacter halobius]
MTHINFRDLRYLVAVADLQHFGRAAAACYVSQPTLSTQIKKLEQYLGVQLVERTSKRVMVTPVGRSIAERARRVLNEVEDIVDTARAAGDPLAGELRLGVIPTLGPYLIPHFFPLLREAYPRLRVLLHEERTAGLLERLRRGGLDAAIMARPVPDEGLEWRTLFREPFHVAMPAGHRLAARGRLRLDDLRAESMLLLEEGHCLRDQALDVCSMVGAREEAEFRATSLETLRQMVASGAGITLLPALAAGPQGGAPAQGLVLRPFAGEPPAREIALFWRRGCAREAAVEALGELIAGLEPVRGLELPLAAEG